MTPTPFRGSPTDLWLQRPALWCQGSSVTWANRYQDCPDVPGRFDQEFCVLGSEGFTTGWHWWEVSVQGPYSFPLRGTASWAIGVAKESVPRKGSFKLSPQEGIWAVGKDAWQQFVTFETSQNLSLSYSVHSSLNKLWVMLDCEAKEVHFVDVVTQTSLYTFQLVGGCQELHGCGASTDREVVEL
ncbi:Tripartite motif-containing protein 10, partial [Ophiophagus hannah]